MNNIGLYIHVPFCKRKCIYCDFYSLSGREELISAYTDTVVQNLKETKHSFDTVYFGGGTPSLLSGEQVYKILSAADITNNAEISAECNPDSADEKKLHELHNAGINRISVGIQSLDDRELKTLGRLHTSEQAKNTLQSAAKAGFQNISADLMLGIPYQTEDIILKNINGLSSLGVHHISAYMLKIEEGTPLSGCHELISACADDDTSAYYYEAAVSALKAHGLYQYEISNFAGKGYECRHNLKYWRCEDYLGIGPSAHSCVDSVRYAVKNDLDAFISSKMQNTIITDDNACTEEERLMLGLRLTEGIDLDGMAIGEDVLKKSKVFEKAGLMNISGSRISLTLKGMLLSNEIICRLI